MSDDDATAQDGEDTTVLDRRQLSGQVDEPTVIQPAVNLDKQPDAGAPPRVGAPPPSPTPTPTPAPAPAQHLRPTPPPTAPTPSWQPPQPARSAATAGPVTPGAMTGGAGPAVTGGAPAPRRRVPLSEDHVRLPSRRPWTSITAAIAALIFAGDAVYELVHNWSGAHGLPVTGSRFATAYYLLEHSATSITTTLAALAAGRHYNPAVHLDARLALGSYAVVWLIVGLLLLLARGSGIVLGLAWCGAVGLVAVQRTQGAITVYGLHHLPQLASVGAAFAPLALIIAIVGLGGSRRARLYSARPADPEFVDVNDPGEVWRG